jgi:hypothetical protein
MSLEKLAKAGKIQLKFESFKSLLHDYFAFKKKKKTLLLSLVLKEVQIRTEKSRAVFKRVNDKVEMFVLYPDKYYIVKPDAEEHIQVKNYNTNIDLKGFNAEEAATIQIYQIAGKMRNVIQRKKQTAKQKEVNKI